uniref:Uncharacterized protein n=1 Tax=Rhabditophanes sp. KR3021 TaxID=114890 RepID=A0AC35UE29_9BILA
MQLVRLFYSSGILVILATMLVAMIQGEQFNRKFEESEEDYNVGFYPDNYRAVFEKVVKGDDGQKEIIFHRALRNLAIGRGDNYRPGK